MDVYFDKITVDERGDREGFPPKLAIDILLLTRLHARAYPFSNSGAPYSNGGMRASRGIGFRWQTSA